MSCNVASANLSLPQLPSFPHSIPYCNPPSKASRLSTTLVSISVVPGFFLLLQHGCNLIFEWHAKAALLLRHPWPSSGTGARLEGAAGAPNHPLLLYLLDDVDRAAGCNGGDSCRPLPRGFAQSLD
eukprot:1138345-Pelagomonas_calceolata.AAC.4